MWDQKIKLRKKTRERKITKIEERKRKRDSERERERLRERREREERERERERERDGDVGEPRKLMEPKSSTISVVSSVSSSSSSLAGEQKLLNGRYVKVKKLGMGQFGVAWLVDDKKDAHLLQSVTHSQIIIVNAPFTKILGF